MWELKRQRLQVLKRNWRCRLGEPDMPSDLRGSNVDGRHSSRSSAGYAGFVELRRPRDDQPRCIESCTALHWRGVHPDYQPHLTWIRCSQEPIGFDVDTSDKRIVQQSPPATQAATSECADEGCEDVIASGHKN